MTVTLRYLALTRGFVGSAILNRRSWRGLFALAVVATACGQDEEVYAPETYDISRYEHIWEQSPFIVETQVVTQSEGLNARYKLTGLGSVAGTPIAFIYDGTTLGRFSVAEGETSESGVELLAINLERDLRDSKATIRVGSEQADISYDPASLLQTASTGVEPQVGGINPPSPPGSQPQSIVKRRTVPVPAAAPAGSTPTAPPAKTILTRRQITIPTN